MANLYSGGAYKAWKAIYLGTEADLSPDIDPPTEEAIPLSQDVNSLEADPKYLDFEKGNFCLAPDSPARAKKIGPAALHNCQ